MSKMKNIMIQIMNDPEFYGDTTKYMEKVKLLIKAKQLKSPSNNKVLIDQLLINCTKSFYMV